MEKKEVLVYDMIAFPTMLNWDVWLDIKEKHRLILWDSSNYRNSPPFEPKIYNAEHTYRLVDLSQITSDEKDELLKSIKS